MVSAGRRYLPRGWGDLGRQLAIWLGFALAYQLARGLTDRNRRLWAGWVVEGATRRFYHAGDTGYFGGFTEIGGRLGPFDLAAIPVGAYRPSARMRPVHLDPEEAVQAALDLKASRAVAMHFGTFDLTDEPLDEPPARFLAEAARRGLGERAWVLRVGETRAW